MELFEIENIKLSRIPSNEECIYIRSEKIQQCSKIIEERGIKYISINRFDYGETEHINFLKKEEFRYIQKLHINSNRVLDIEPIYDLEDLEQLTISSLAEINIDFNKLSRLKYIGFEWSKKYIGIENLVNLEHFHIRNFPFENFKHLSKLTKLKNIELTRGKITNLEGIEQFPELEELKFHYVRRLNSLKGINKIHKKLKAFGIYSAPNLFEVSQLENATNLNTILISKVKEINSLKFLNKLKNLKEVLIKPNNIKTRDGDLEPLLTVLENISSNG